MTMWRCEDCDHEVIGKVRRGRCDPCYRKHLKQQRELGADLATPPRKYRPRKKVPPKLTVAERIFLHTTPGWGGCILFTGALCPDGYALVKNNKRMVRASRQIYLNLVDEISAGLVLDHVCHTEDLDCPGGKACLHRRCVNPHHLEPVTLAENNIRGRGLSAENFFKTACKRGHAFTPENTRLSKRLRIDGKPQRNCRTCLRDAQQAWLIRNRSRAA